ncbi:MAG: methionyl-tRNA formyltransferase [Candidatus Doudnabacteria bacterium]|nr:methionyl-tRNA formyltransferase [Candidatus Doudnabacteria bacterium]
MKIVFFGTDGVAVHALRAVAAVHDVVTVVTVPDAPVGRARTLTESEVAVVAYELGIFVLKPATLKQNEELVAALQALHADLFVVAVYGKIIPENILQIPLRGCVNIHPSLLPLYRGPAPIRTPLLNGDTETGVSIMLMDAEMDHGPLLASQAVAIEPNDTNVTLTEKLGTMSAPLLLKAVSEYEAGTCTPLPQDHSKATFTHFVKKEDGRIDWNKSAQDIYNMWRAYQPWPGIFTTWNGKLLKISSCIPFSPSGGDVTASVTERVPGTVLEGGIVACGENTYLQILTLQPEGKQIMDMPSFLNGNKQFIGSVLKK